VDLVDFQILDQLQKTRNISRAAEKVSLSQPSVSVRLSRLRRHFGDPLFARTADGMQPTPRGDGVVAAARQALLLIEGAVGPQETFDPQSSHRTFRICLTDIGQIAILPKLLVHLQTVAPNVCIEVLDPDDDLERMLGTGGVDYAVGVTLDRTKGLVSQALFQERFACLASKMHPRIGKSLTKQQFFREGLVLSNLRSPSTGLRIMNRTFDSFKSTTRVRLRVPSLLGLAQVVANTELLAIVPWHLGTAFAQDGHIKVLEVPIHMPSFKVMQYWHRRYHLDPGHRWLRTTMFELLRN
jgi:DNA-binding transcriptional LysR family regulator